MAGGGTDINKARLISQAMRRLPYNEGWQFRVEFDNQPADFDLFVKDVTTGEVEYETQPVVVGTRVLTYPKSAQPTAVTMTVRDTEDERIFKWAKAEAARVIRPDGTVPAPQPGTTNGFLRKLRRYTLSHAGEDINPREYEVWITRVGDITESRDSHGFLEFPLSFIQFRS